MNHVLSGLAANASLPPELLDRLIAVADTETATHLVHRPDLSHAQAIALASRAEEIAVSLAHAGRITADDVDPTTQPYVALALLTNGVGRSEWAQAFARAPDVKHRVELAACPGLSPDVVEVLAIDSDVRVVAELALWTTSQTAARLAVHPHAEVRRAVAANEATPPAVLAALLTEAGMAPAQRCLVCDREETPFVHDPECPRLDCDLLPGDSCDAPTNPPGSRRISWRSRTRAHRTRLSRISPTILRCTCAACSPVAPTCPRQSAPGSS